METPSIFMGVFAVICFVCGWGFSKFRRIEIHNVKELRIDVEKLITKNLSFLPTERAADAEEQNGHIAQQSEGRVTKPEIIKDGLSGPVPQHPERQK